MDLIRFDQLKTKATGEEGLSRAEADELGRLYAEAAGQPYANADDVKHPDERTALVPGLDDEVLQAEEELQHEPERRERRSA